MVDVIHNFPFLALSLILRDHNTVSVPGDSQSSCKGSLVVLWETLSDTPHYRRCRDRKNITHFLSFSLC